MKKVEQRMGRSDEKVLVAATRRMFDCLKARFMPIAFTILMEKDIETLIEYAIETTSSDLVSLKAIRNKRLQNLTPGEQETYFRLNQGGPLQVAATQLYKFKPRNRTHKREIEGYVITNQLGQHTSTVRLSLKEISMMLQTEFSGYPINVLFKQVTQEALKGAEVSIARMYLFELYLLSI